MQPVSEKNAVDPETDAGTALTNMMQHGNPKLMVAKGDHFAGIVSQSDILRFLAIKLDLEGSEGSEDSGAPPLSAQNPIPPCSKAARAP